MPSPTTAKKLSIGGDPGTATNPWSGGIAIPWPEDAKPKETPKVAPKEETQKVEVSM
jgi:hypothetical protein